MTFKKPKRRKEIIDTAEQLFYLKGYENTSINDILKQIGASKGAIYHYFESKNEILEAIIQKHINEGVSILDSIASDNSLSVLDKLSQIILLSFKKKLKKNNGSSEIDQALKEDSNIVLYDKLRNQWIVSAQPIVEQIINQGIKNNYFKIDRIHGVARVLLIIISDASDQIKKIINSSYNKKNLFLEVEEAIVSLQVIIERLLNINPNSLPLINKEMINEWLILY